MNWWWWGVGITTMIKPKKTNATNKTVQEWLPPIPTNAKETLLARFADKQRIFARFEPELARRLATHSDMAKVWKVLGDTPDDANALYVDVRNAFEAAHKEFQRPLSTEEKKGFERVNKAINSLQDAIEKSSLPKNFRSEGYLLTCPKRLDRPDINLGLGWHDTSNLSAGFGYSIDLLGLLEIYSDLLKQYMAGLPPRAVTRRSVDPLTAAFVRHLVFQLVHSRGKEHHGLVAYVATAVLNLDASEPLDKVGVQAILKDRPPAFSQPKGKKESP